MLNHRPLRILFVEDSEDDKELLLDALAAEFPHIVHGRVESAAELRAVLSEQAWDIIICDHALPALNAPAALRITQESGSEAPFIIVSGSMPEEIAVSAMTAGAADMISKQNISRLVPAVKRELKKTFEVLNLRHIAEHDQLTGLPKREWLEKTLKELSTGPNAAPMLALMIININRFSLIRRTLGMEAADETLRLFAERLCQSVGKAGLVASLGEDRFAVLLTQSEASADPVPTVERINREAARPFNVGDRELFLALRIGIVNFPHDGHDLHRLLVNAEIAMGQVDVGSKCNYRFFNAGMNDAGKDRLVLEQALHRALQQKEFELHYQPQYDARKGRIIGVEALLRWQLPDGTRVSPADFIPLLEETGLIVPVGEWVLRAACAQNLEWQRAGHPPIKVAVNLSAIQFRQSDLLAMVKRALDETGLHQDYLELEITENVAMHNEESVIATLAQLRRMGISLAIDDFGTGYSSLSYLRRFPVNKLKVDRSFINDITEMEPSSPIVKAIVSLARNLGLGVIAEGVETPEQVGFLLSCDCTETQGYLFGRPVPPEEVWGLFGEDGRMNEAHHLHAPAVAQSYLPNENECDRLPASAADIPAMSGAQEPM